MSNNNSGVVVLRAVACFMVILIHVSSETPFMNGDAWNLSNMMNSFSRIAVPVFIIISSYLMSGKKYDCYISFLKKRVIRIIPAIVAWSYFYGWFYNKDILSGSFFTSVLTGPTMFHLWYLYAIVGIYLLIPLISSFKDVYGKNGIFTLLGIWYALGCVIPLITYMNGVGVSYIENYNISQIGGIAGYAIAGVAMRPLLELQIHKKTYGIIFLITSSTTAYLSWLCSMNAGSVYPAFYSYTSPLVAISAMSLCCMLLKMDFKTPQSFIMKFIKSISSVSLGIYCIHMYIFTNLDIEFNEHIYNKSDGYTLYLLTMPLAIMIASYVICCVLSKIPFLRKCV